MIQSMTAFARRDTHGDWGSVAWEIRAVNHRYLEINLKIPDNFMALEPLLRELARKYVQRGKVECALRHRPDNAKNGAFQVNMPVVEHLMNASRQVAQHIQHSAPLDVLDVLAWPGVVQMPEMDLNVLQEPILNLFEAALQDLVAMRQREGAALKATLDERLTSMSAAIERARVFLPNLLAMQREKIAARFHEIKLELDSARLEQEMILFTHRIDVAEELDRLSIHINEVRYTLEQKAAQGRRLDFLMQELHREANTLGSKSSAPEMTAVAVELKVLIEQMREQVQNIE